MRQFMHSFHGLTAPASILDGVREGKITSFCLFSGLNVETPAQLRALTDSLARAAAEGGQPMPLIGLDQEGGQLMAVTQGATELPGNMALGATRSPELARAAGRVLGRELLAMGINLNFAPSLDVNINPANPVIGTRSFGDDPAWVATLGAALIEGMQAEGVIATAKHFPGHGDTAADTHHNEGRLTHDRARLDAVELPPFGAAIKAGVGAILPAHLVIDAIDKDNPATLSENVLRRLLRDEMGFDGLVITDAMDMHAVAQFGAVESVSGALAAGADLIMLGHLPDQLNLMAHFAEQESAESLARLAAAQARLIAHADWPELAIVGSAEHWAVAQQIAEAAVTLEKNEGGQLPLKAGQSLALVTPKPANLTPADTSALVKLQLADFLREAGVSVQEYQIDIGATEAEIAAALEFVQAANADTVLVATINAHQDASQVALLDGLRARGHQPIVAALRNPYDLALLPWIDTYLCTYSIRPVSLRALVRVLMGEIEARGVIPCQLSAVGG